MKRGPKSLLIVGASIVVLGLMGAAGVASIVLTPNRLPCESLNPTPGTIPAAASSLVREEGGFVCSPPPDLAYPNGQKVPTKSAVELQYREPDVPVLKDYMTRLKAAGYERTACAFEIDPKGKRSCIGEAGDWCSETLCFANSSLKVVSHPWPSFNRWLPKPVTEVSVFIGPTITAR
ncbi:MAG: hypothetical protein H6718_30215 [Polyangiaceae bacterium]|nr:hypothetical protein [Myxococcales bacterium]MCB9589728.1 hypothetical protein [Polyangiaceae bacterium]